MSKDRDKISEIGYYVIEKLKPFEYGADIRRWGGEKGYKNAEVMDAAKLLIEQGIVTRDYQATGKWLLTDTGRKIKKSGPV